MDVAVRDAYVDADASDNWSDGPRVDGPPSQLELNASAPSGKAVLVIVQVAQSIVGSGVCVLVCVLVWVCGCYWFCCTSVGSKKTTTLHKIFP